MAENTSRPGGKVDDRDAPPYEGRTSGREPSGEDRRASVERQMAETREQVPGQVTTPVEESPLRSEEVTDEAPDSPKGVGESTTRRGEDIVEDDGKERGRTDEGADPATGRPRGRSDDSDATTVG